MKTTAPVVFMNQRSEDAAVVFLLHEIHKGKGDGRTDGKKDQDKPECLVPAQA